MQRISAPLFEVDASGRRTRPGMDATALRTLQAPIKQRYRDDPSTARIHAHAEASLKPDAIACTVPTWQGETVAGLHPAAGGDGSEACSADLLLQALVACAGVTLNAVLTAMGVEVRSAKVIADGIWDARGTLGVDREVPVGLTEIDVRFEIDSDAEREKLERIVQTVERYCVIFQTLRTSPKMSVALA
jgi:uncharacterized OsmC-like protein